MAIYIIFAILMFGVLIALHEFGHFITAKLLGVRVNEFAIGMGPLVWSRKRGETQYSLRAIPMGGFCAMEGEEDASDDPRSFSNKAGWKKFLILVAGSAMNFLTGLVLVIVVTSQFSYLSIPVITGFMDGFPYESVDGLLPGDRIISVNGERIYTASDVQFFFDRALGKDMDLVIERNGQRLEQSGVSIMQREYEYGGEKAVKYGILFTQEEPTPLGVLRESWYQAVDMVRLVKVSLVDLFTGRAGVKDMSGPIGIVNTIGEVGVQSPTVGIAVMKILNFTAFIAINLAVMNLLPIPALDGGRIFFLLVNWLFTLVTRKKLDPKYEGYVNAAGFLCLILLMAVVAFNDIVKLFV